MSHIQRTKAGYKAVAQDDPEDPVDIKYVPREKKPSDQYTQLFEKIATFLHAMFWVGLAGATWYYTDLVHVHSDPRIRSTSLALALCCGFIATCAFIYVYVDNFRRGSPNNNYFEEYPKTIYTLTFSGLLFWFFVCLALYPVFGWKSIPLIIVNFMGFIMSFSLLSL